MKAYVRSGYGSPDVLEYTEIPTRVPGPEEVLVKVHAASVNTADIDYLRGRPLLARLGTGLRRPNNEQLGLDLAGRVEAVGGRVARFGPGDLVMGDLTEHGFGAFAEYVCAPEDAFAPAPKGSDYDEAATLPQSGVLAVQSLRRRERRVEAGHKVLINGAGGNVGPFAVQIAKAAGAEVTGVDCGRKLDMLRSIGADHVLDYTLVDFTKMGERYDWILDIAPFHSMLACRRSLASGGTYVMIPATIRQVAKAMILGPVLSLFGSKKLGMPAWGVFAPTDVALLTRMYELGDLRPVIDREFPLEQVRQALHYQESGRARGKVIIVV